MASISNVPREIESSMRDAIGPNIKIYIKRMVKLEVKPERFEKRVIALAGCRFLILAAKTPTKIEQNISFLDIQAIESKKENQLLITVDGKTLTFLTLDMETEEVNLIITHIGRSIKNVFPAFPVERVIKKIEVHPPDRLKMMHDLIRDVEHKETGPCGGFSIMYACMCDYHNLPYREEVAWDVDTIYLSQDSRELCLRDFDHLNSKDLIPIVAALEHNTWFTKLNASDVKLNMETQNEILKVMVRNAVIEELYLSNTGISADFVTKLATAVLSNSGSQLSKVDLSKNSLSDAAIVSFIGSLGNLTKGLVSFNISSAKITGKGLSRIAETLAQNADISRTLQFLNMADNLNPKGEEIQSLYNLLAQPNTITHLDLSGIDCSLESLCGALLRGSCPTLTHLLVARNVFSHKKGKEVIVQGTWKTFFSSVYGLEVLDLSGCKLPPEALKELLLGIASNLHIKNLQLDLSNNDLQGPGGAALGGSLANVMNVSSLDISNNGFDQSLVSLLDLMKGNKSIKHLAIGQNFSKVKNYPMVLESVVNLIQEESSTIESLSLADSKLKNHLSVIINALGSNTTLTEIDISGNSVGDLGARMLSKALQINNKLRTLKWDRNNTTAQGFEDVASALKKNFTVKKMPSPLNDISKAIMDNKERTEAAIQEIESILQRNHSPQKYSSDQAYRLQQGFLISSTQQMVDRLVVQVQDTINALDSFGSTDEIQPDIDRAGSVVKDADNSKQLLPELQNIAMKSCDVGNPVEKQLQMIATDLKDVLNRQMKKSVSDMVECTTNQCAAITSDKKFMEDMVGGCSEKSALPPHFTKNVLDSVETSIYNKLSELNLAVAAYISDTTIDGVIEALHTSHKTLTNHLNKKRSESRKDTDGKSSKDNENQLKKADDEDNEKPLMQESNSVDSPLSPSYRVQFFEDKETPCSTPDLTTKRKTITGRKQRPPTVIDAEQVKKALLIHESKSSTPSCLIESDLESGSEVKGNISVTPMSGIFQEGGRVDSVDSLESLEPPKPVQKETRKETPKLAPIEIDELPALQTSNLQHLGKGRPKGPQNRRRPTPRPQQNTEVGSSGLKEDEGLDSFFETTVVLPPPHVSTPAPNPKPSGKKSDRKESIDKQKPAEKPSKPEEPKKKGGLFGFGRKSEDKSADDKKKGGFSLFKLKPKNTGKSPDRSGSVSEQGQKPEPPSAADKPRKESIKEEEPPKATEEEEEEETKEEEAKKEEEESPSETPEEQDVMRPKKPIGGVGLGMGPNMGHLMAEMQIKRFSQVQREKDARRPAQALVPPGGRKIKPDTPPPAADTNVKKPSEEVGKKEEVKPVKAAGEDKTPDKDKTEEASKTEEKVNNDDKDESEEEEEEEEKTEESEDGEEDDEKEEEEKSDDNEKKEEDREKKKGNGEKKPEGKVEKPDEKKSQEVNGKSSVEEGKPKDTDKKSEDSKKHHTTKEPKEESETKRHSLLSTVQARSKPAPAPRGSGPAKTPENTETPRPPSSSSLSSGSSRNSNELKPKPSPPVKPRPPRTAPKPRASNDVTDSVEDSPKQEEGVVVDSATLRLSVGEKIKRLSQNFENNPPAPENAQKRRSHNMGARPPSGEAVAVKSASLPRDLTPSGAVDGKKNSSKDTHSAKDSKSSHATENSAEKKGGSKIEKKVEGPEGQNNGNTDGDRSSPTQQSENGNAYEEEVMV